MLNTDPLNTALSNSDPAHGLMTEPLCLPVTITTNVATKPADSICLLFPPTWPEGGGHEGPASTGFSGSPWVHADPVCFYSRVSPYCEQTP